VKQHPTLVDALPGPWAAAPVERGSRLCARALSALCAASLGLSSACRSGDVEDRAPAPAVVSAGGAAASGPSALGNAAGAAATRPVMPNDGKPPFASKPWRIPVGPNLAITPGKGLGPIRFGAHLDTIERLIGEPCEDKRKEGATLICRYSAQAVDFVLRGDGLEQIRAHRLGRPFNPDGKLDYGIFNGRFDNGVAFGMLDRGVRELLGAPRSVRKLEGDNPNHTVEVHEYDGATLEFDRISPESVVLGGVILNAPPGGAKPGADAPSPDSAATKAAEAPRPPRKQRPLH
jgi:hypothetical protein